MKKLFLIGLFLLGFALPSFAADLKYYLACDPPGAIITQTQIEITANPQSAKGKEIAE